MLRRGFLGRRRLGLAVALSSFCVLSSLCVFRAPRLLSRHLPPCSALTPRLPFSASPRPHSLRLFHSLGLSHSSLRLPHPAQFAALTSSTDCFFSLLLSLARSLRSLALLTNITLPIRRHINKQRRRFPSSDPKATFVLIQQLVIQPLNQRRCHEGSEDLSGPVSWYFAPGESSETCQH